jgi:hypothetical protein
VWFDTAAWQAPPFFIVLAVLDQQNVPASLDDTLSADHFSIMSI